jgi:hypothetical protein
MVFTYAAGNRSSLIVALAICATACGSPTSPSSKFLLSGVIRDSSSLTPVADATVQVTTGSLAGQMTVSDREGRFRFGDLASAVEPTTLAVFRVGYFPVTMLAERPDVVILLATSRLPIEGDYTMTFAAAGECTMLPSPLRRRAYSATIAVSSRLGSSLDAIFAIELSGADFLAELRTVSLSIRASTGRFFVASHEAERRWGDDVPIYERVGATGCLSLHGVGATPLTVSDTAFDTTFEGILSYCPTSTNRFGPGYPPQCTAPAVDCQSNGHQLTGVRR